MVENMEKENDVIYNYVGSSIPVPSQPWAEVRAKHTEVVEASITLYRYGKPITGYSHYSDAWTMKIPEARRLYEQLGKALGEVGE